MLSAPVVVKSLTMHSRTEAQMNDTTTAARPAHTPGPWYVNSVVERDPGKPGRVVHNVFNQDGLYAHIAECWNEANARLIAAAPELLNAARAIVHGLHMGYTADEILRESGSVRERLIAAVAKATGGAS